MRANVLFLIWEWFYLLIISLMASAILTLYRKSHHTVRLIQGYTWHLIIRSGKTSGKAHEPVNANSEICRKSKSHIQLKMWIIQHYSFAWRLQLLSPLKRGMYAYINTHLNMLTSIVKKNDKLTTVIILF